MQQTKPNLKNPYTLPLRDAQREYQRIFGQKIWYPQDVARLEKLNAQIDRLKLLVRVFDASK